jgi:hypothetical protein
MVPYLNGECIRNQINLARKWIILEIAADEVLTIRRSRT